MITIRARAEEYLAMRRKLGFKLVTFARYLMLFVAYLEQTGATVVTTQAALAWAIEATSSTDRAYLARRLMIVRIFARHLQTLEPATEVPPEDLLPHHSDRITPHLFTPDELDALLAAASRLRPAFRALTYRTLFALLAVTGLRVGEACHLDRVDVDLNSGVLTVRDSKFGKSRQVPVHDSTTAALADYRHQRDQRPNAQTNPAFLVSIMGTRLRPKTMSVPFQARRRCGNHRPARTASPATARPAPYLRHRNSAGLVPPRRRCPGPATAAGHLSRARRPQVHLLVPQRIT